MAEEVMCGRNTTEVAAENDDIVHVESSFCFVVSIVVSFGCD